MLTVQARSFSYGNRTDIRPGRHAFFGEWHSSLKKKKCIKFDGKRRSYSWIWMQMWKINVKLMYTDWKFRITQFLSPLVEFQCLESSLASKIILWSSLALSNRSGEAECKFSKWTKGVSAVKWKHVLPVSKLSLPNFQVKPSQLVLFCP